MGQLPFEKLRRELLVRREAETTPKYGANPEKRTTAQLLERGIVVIDKPAGPTSHQVSDYVKKILDLGKAGHSGTLDPQVTGVLPIALGKGTRITHALLQSGKEYVCSMHLHEERTAQEIAQLFTEFTGKIKQLPPVKSAIKRQWRYRKIYYLELIEIEEKEVLFRVGCQAGTYIRKLCHDFGQRLGCGAHMAGLRRTKSGPFTEDQAITLQDLADAYHYWKENEKPIAALLPIESGVSHLPKVWVLDSAVDPLCHGQSLKVPGIAKIESDIQLDEMVAVMTLKDELVMIGTAKMISKAMQQAERGIAVKPDQVFMEPGLYPRKG